MTRIMLAQKFKKISAISYVKFAAESENVNREIDTIINGEILVNFIFGLRKNAIESIFTCVQKYLFIEYLVDFIAFFLNKNLKNNMFI